METRFPCVDCVDDDMFKSYYVVWKLNDSEKYYERDNEV